MIEQKLTDQIIGAAVEVHRELGPGLLESAYQRALAYELSLRGLQFEEQKLCSVTYKDLLVGAAYRLDFLVGGKVVVELKAVDALLDVHEAQVLTYLKFSACRVGLLFNFRTTLLMKHGFSRLVV
jgi:GxxExxY protein